MGQLVLGVAGAVVGSFFGAPQIGWAIGSAIGGAVFAEDQVSVGPRVGDMQVTSSTLGVALPHLYGSWRTAGNVIDASPMREVESRTSESAKGGPEAVSISYSYNIDLAVDLCQAGAAGVIRIWSNGKLIYNMGDTATVDEVLASTSGAVRMRFYDGAETQLPDPTLQAIHGAETPAYRGRSYVVLSGLDCPQGRVPQLSFEVAQSATTSARTFLLGTAPRPDNFYISYAITADKIIHVVEQLGAGAQVYLVERSGVSFLRTLPLPAKPGAPGGTDQSTGFRPMPGTTRAMLMRAGASLTNVWDVDLLTGLEQLVTVAVGPIGTWSNSDLNAAAFDPITGRYAFVAGGGPAEAAYYIVPGAQPTLITGYTSDRSPVATYGGFAYLLSDNGTDITLHRFSTDPDGIIPNRSPIVLLGAPTASVQTSAINVDASGIWVSLSRTGGVDLYSVTEAGWELVGAAAISPVDAASAPGKTPTFYTNGVTAILASPSDGTYHLVQLNAIAAAEVPVADIIEDQLVRAGVPALRVDVSSVTDTTHGYFVGRVSNARTNLGSVIGAYFIDGVEEDGLLRFTPRALKTPVGSIPYTKLAGSTGGDAPDGPFPLTRAQESEMPRTYVVNYVDVSADYQGGSEKAIKQVTTSINDVVQEFPLALSADKARQVAEVMLFNAWNQRNGRSGKTDRSFARLSPGDFVSIEYPPGVVSTKMLTRMGDDGAVLSFDAVDANADLYTYTPQGASIGNAQTVRPLAALARAIVLDASILRDQDDSAGVYVAIGGSGAELFIGDDEADLQTEGAVGVGCAFGSAEGALADFAPNFLDEINTLTVTLAAGSLASTTYERVISGIDNYCALGAPGRWELLQFRTATSLGSGRYALTGLNRGRRGTSRLTGTHAAGDTFVLLRQPGMFRPEFQVGELGRSKLYVPVAPGRSLDLAIRYAAPLSFEGLKPHAPYRLLGSRASSNLTITWERRSRYLDNWLLGVVPLGEASEAYEVDIFTSATYTTVVRTITATSKTATYSSAQQVTDFGSNQATVYVRIYQLSAAIGRGYHAQGAL